MFGKLKSSFRRSSVSKLIEVAELSAAVASECTLQKRSRGGDFCANGAAWAQAELEKCVGTLRHKQRLSPRLTRVVASLCWHAAWDEAWKQRLGEVATFAGRYRTIVAGDLEFQRRFHDLFAELAIDGAQAEIALPMDQNNTNTWRGVNLGGWLLWETGPCDSAPMVAAAGDEVPPDEWTLSLRLRQKYGDEKAAEIVRQHRLNFITKTDFEKIAALGLNAVRIPFSYWLVDGPRPGEPFLGPDLDVLDNAFKWAAEVGLKVVLCFHGTVGFQSDHQASGRRDESWTPSQWDTVASVAVLQRVAARYRDVAALGAITVVNEPAYEIPLEQLRQYYKDSYHAIRNAGVSEHVQIVMPLYHREMRDFEGHFSQSEGFHNVVFDAHVYQVFGEDWNKMSLADHLRYASGQSRCHHLDKSQTSGERLIVSEWSLALPIRAKSMIALEWAHLTRSQKHAVTRSFAVRQLRTFAASSQGWFFWNWKDEDSLPWSLSELVEHRLFPLGRSFPAKSALFSARPAAAAEWYCTGREPKAPKDKKQTLKATIQAAKSPELRWRHGQSLGTVRKACERIGV
mmetsp:Transcript_82793/g.208456  ORF Transcript_82793/g.208456 Transcript_82793/m.208456 type:complete len:570 (+) Transcript_82793:221-1930(+)